jgi:hypothetical protein
MTRYKTRVALGMLLALGVWGARSAGAVTNPAYEDLTVTFSGNLSVKVDGVQYSTRALGNLAAGVTVVPTSSATVTNDGSFTEKWQLSTLDVTGAPNWSLVTTTGNTGGGTYCSTTVGGAGCPGLEQYALQALFISSATAGATCPTNVSAAWDTYVSTVGGTTNTYLTTQYADTAVIGTATGNPDGTTGTANGNMLINNVSTGTGQKGLCVRLTMPASVDTATGQQVIQLTITAINGG